MIRIDRINPVRAANALAVVSLVLAIIVALPVALLVLGRAAVGGELAANVAPGFVVLLLLTPIGTAVASWITTVIATLAYNLTVRVTGGVTLEVAEDAGQARYTA